MPVGIPDAGTNRTFISTDFVNWPENLTDNVEIDFFAHTVSPFSANFIDGRNTFSLAQGQVIITVYPVMADPLVVPIFGFTNMGEGRVAGTSPDKIETSSCQENRTSLSMEYYVVGEITRGGQISVISKLDQLEKDVTIAMMKKNTSCVLDAVALALIINHDDHEEKIANVLTSSPVPRPYLRALFQNGRVAFIQDKGTPMQILLSSHNEMLSQLNDLREVVAESSALVTESSALVTESLVRNAELTSQIADLRGMVTDIFNFLKSGKPKK